MKNKKFLFVFSLVAILLLSAFTVTALAFSKGDANGDGKISTRDAKLVLSHTVGSTKLSGEFFRNADMDGNGTLTTEDARKILQLSVDGKAPTSGISLESKPDKTVYFLNAPLKLNGAAVKDNSTGEIIPVTQNMISGFNSASVGEKTVTVNYKGSSVIFKVNVIKKLQKLSLNGLFNNNMVLQREKPLPIFGKGSDGDVVKVTFGNYERTTVVKNGKWEVVLPPMEASSQGQILKVKGMAGERAGASNVLIGDVWLCSGQSNMYWKVRFIKDSHPDYQGPYANVRAYNNLLKDADNPLIRGCWAEPKTADRPLDDIALQNWVISSKTTIEEQSAYGMAFAQYLQPQIGVPVGIVALTQGSTFLSQWIPGGDYYNGMINAVMPFSFKGMLWWQGENDCIKLPDFKESYPREFNTLVNTVRTGFRNPTMPVIQVQLTDFFLGGDRGYGSWAQMQHLQPTYTSDENNTYTVANFDFFDDINNIHSTKKKEAGTRAARLALEKIYNHPTIKGSSPKVASYVKNADGSVLITFADVHERLTFESSLPSFKIKDTYQEDWVSGEIVSDNQILIRPNNNVKNIRNVKYLPDSISYPEIMSGDLPMFGFNLDIK